MFSTYLSSPLLLLSKNTLHSYFHDSKAEFGINKIKRKLSVDLDERTVSITTTTDNDTWSLNEKSTQRKAESGKVKTKVLGLYGIQEKATQTDIPFTTKHYGPNKFELKSRKRARPERSNKLEKQMKEDTFGLELNTIGRLKINKVLKEDS